MVKVIFEKRVNGSMIWEYNSCREEKLGFAWENKGVQTAHRVIHWGWILIPRTSQVPDASPG